MGERLFSGWGIRTLAEGEKRYKADLYHRGPCWPHEMVIAGWSAGKAGNYDAIRKIAEAMLDTAEAFQFRMPELLCGYPRVKGVPPVPYKSANPLQAWAAAGAFAVVHSALGLRFDAVKSEISINTSGLPRSWTPLTLRDLEVDGGTISFRVEPQDSEDFRIRILEQRGNAVKLRDGRTGRSLC
jgi:glycogen debranching enzyme